MKTLHAVDSRGIPVAILELSEGVDATDAELYVLRGNVKGAVDVADDGAETTAGLVESFKEAGYSEEVAKHMATIDDGGSLDYLPRVAVPKWTGLRETRRTAAAGVPRGSVELREENGRLGSIVSINGRRVK